MRIQCMQLWPVFIIDLCGIRVLQVASNIFYENRVNMLLVLEPILCLIPRRASAQPFFPCAHAVQLLLNMRKADYGF